MVIQCGAAALWRELVVANAEPRREKHVVKLCKALKTALRSFDRAGLGCPMRRPGNANQSAAGPAVPERVSRSGAN
jgi:hypothetical protein